MKLQYADADGNWQDVKLADGQSYTVNQNEGNEVKFADTVETDKLRVVFPKAPSWVLPSSRRTPSSR